MKDKHLEKFIMEISKCKDPVVFCGLARVLKVPLVEDKLDENKHPIGRDFGDIFEDVLNAFSAADRRRKRELLKILAQSNKSHLGDDMNADNSKDTTSATAD